MSQEPASEDLNTKVGMLARAIVALVDGEDDADAVEFVRKLAAIGRPSEDLERFMAERAQARRANAQGLAMTVDRHADIRAERERFYETLRGGRER